MWGGSLVKWLLEETHVQKVVSSNPSIVYWMDIFSFIFIFSNKHFNYYNK